MIKIKHIAIWANDIERLRLFYQKYFGAKANSKYTNSKTGFQSYFLSFSSEAKLEIMQRPDIMAIENRKRSDQEFIGYAHLAISVGSEKLVDKYTKQLILDGFQVLDGPRYTGDGFYESVILDPENNRIEITT